MRLLGRVRVLVELVLVVAIALLATGRRTSGVEWPRTVVYRVPTHEKVVALTFDDGPHPTFTPELLRTLDKYGVKATFFMIGDRVEKYPEIVKAVLKGGHVIGNHTYTHPHDLELDTKAQMIRELERCERVIERMTDERTHLFRPPRGLVDGAMLTIADEEGYTTILWTISADHHDAPTPEMMAQRVLKHMVPGGIVLAHDGRFGTRWKDVAATPIIIESLQKQGYRFVTIPELLKIGAESR